MPLLEKTSAYVESFIAQVSLQSFYATLFTFLSALSTGYRPKPKRASKSAVTSPASSHNNTKTLSTLAEEDNETSGPAEPDNSDLSEEEKEEKFDRSQDKPSEYETDKYELHAHYAEDSPLRN